MSVKTTGSGPITRGTIARRTGCNPETVRYYEKIGLLPEPPRTASGYRQYESDHEQRLRFILRGRELGFSVHELKSLLALVDQDAVSCGEVERLARTHLESVHAKIADLRRMERSLGRTIHACSGKDVPDCPLIDALLGDPSPD
jgi:MerR family mercuric resistance operon transcriptional regulator